MNYEYEIEFLSDVLKKCRIGITHLSQRDGAELLVDSRLRSIIGSYVESNATVQAVLGDVEDLTQYKIKNELKLRYLLMRLPIMSERNLLLIGPYLTAPVGQKEFLEACEKHGLPPSVQRPLFEYYLSLPLIPENDRVFIMIDAFCERVFKTPSFSVVELDKSQSTAPIFSQGGSQAASSDEVLANMQMMEARYAFENELMLAVTLGQQHKVKMLSTAFDEQMFERRVQDPVRNAKNYCIIMNTLLRKSAEQGGVHPVYVDRVSSGFALKIEHLVDAKGISELMQEMFNTYCRLVVKHSTKNYSTVVKKTVLLIDSDISAELSLATLARLQNVSSGYLATVFKKETGKTVSEYVRDKRIEHALYLLSTTSLQIQTVAMHCGIMDVQYFSKIFKKKMGKTPREYREDR